MASLSVAPKPPSVSELDGTLGLVGRVPVKAGRPEVIVLFIFVVLGEALLQKFD
jgi:hypothetical protein